MTIEITQQEEQCILAVKKADVRFHYNGTRKVTYIALTTNKIIEMKINGLLTDEALEKYTHICVLYKDQKIVIPIIQGAWQTHQSKESTVLRVRVAEGVGIYKHDIDNWHNVL